MPVDLGLPLPRAATAAPPAPVVGAETRPAVSTAARPDTSALVDRFGRVAHDLRVSLTDRCNLRCEYCMPPEGFDWMPTAQVLADDEVIRLITIAVEHLGVREVRFTGGEPLLRKGLERIVAATSALRTADGEVPESSLTTNGLGLAHRAGALAEAGLARVNISLDSLDRETYATLARRDRLPDVLAGINAADAAGLKPVKINSVLMRGLNEAHAPDLLAFALRRGFELRFIEQMPLGPPEMWKRGDMLTAEEILQILGTRFDLTPQDPAERGAAPAELFTVAPTDDVPGGTVGVIASVTQPFCGACDRTRLTADGQVRTCLFSRTETDLRAMLRGDADDQSIAEVWRIAMWGKLAGHGIDDPGFLQPQRPMSAIGG
ncbi:GTP 3',8-cyclase MoaA [Georgenia yuyongxinii]|uniref:GTP 3',8-cyclase n=1 Tax=Georgenia yuyongxinii TaxID=2589797 RepID=A0A5B8C4J7_9MICO|nr:GTP 3',8-cyclase MoaA [Georgenia yuyongxinii]QDC25504.1 GTP 3',8-cyclase MoaA [Georgenia yuyongxinii]